MRQTRLFLHVLSMLVILALEGRMARGICACGVRLAPIPRALGWKMCASDGGANGKKARPLSSLRRLMHLSRPYASRYFPSLDGRVRTARPVSWHDCSTGDDLFRLDELTLSPDPPRRSAPLTVQLRGLLHEPLSAGVVNFTVRFGGLQLLSDSRDGCTALSQEPTLPQCPVPAGPIAITHTVNLPWQIPPGRYLIDVTGETLPDRRRIFCLQLDIAIDFSSGAREDSDTGTRDE